MPLHLLGKKSWNVYNADNIARVRRDEAAAKAAEEAEEQRMQEIDAQRRLAILRGEVPPPIEDEKPPKDEEPPVRNRDASQRTSTRRKRKLLGEDDTDFEMRIARENDNSALVRIEPEKKKSTSSVPLVDHNGHIDLLGDEKSRAHAEKNEEAEKEAKKKNQSYEDQYTMRFSNATGKDGVLKPWYSQSDAAAPDASTKDVWGNQDPNRKERDAKRIASNDPLAMMKKGASKVREIKQERKRFQEEREEELKQMRRDERHREKRRRRHYERDRSRERHRSRDRDEERSPSRHERSHRSREGRHRNSGHSGSRSRRHERHDREGSRQERRHYEESEERKERHRGDNEPQKRDPRFSEGVGHERRRHHSKN
ncbi:hypothetical protein H9Q69_008696 [Fusarium xylarioides]|nr:hypothetical protein H9Q69_008696 [Fusarium xylarioides]